MQSACMENRLHAHMTLRDGELTQKMTRSSYNSEQHFICQSSNSVSARHIRQKFQLSQYPVKECRYTHCTESQIVILHCPYTVKVRLKKKAILHVQYVATFPQ